MQYKLNQGQRISVTIGRLCRELFSIDVPSAEGLSVPSEAKKREGCEELRCHRRPHPSATTDKDQIQMAGEDVIFSPLACLLAARSISNKERKLTEGQG